MDGKEDEAPPERLEAPEQHECAGKPVFHLEGCESTPAAGADLVPDMRRGLVYATPPAGAGPEAKIDILAIYPVGRIEHSCGIDHFFRHKESAAGHICRLPTPIFDVAIEFAYIPVAGYPDDGVEIPSPVPDTAGIIMVEDLRSDDARRDSTTTYRH